VDVSFNIRKGSLSDQFAFPAEFILVAA